jgi:predicted phosphodiesterase
MSQGKWQGDKIGAVSDTHSNRNGALSHIIAEFKRRGVNIVVHCGDILPEHVSNELFDNFPVICAIVDTQKEDPLFNENCPEGWKFTRSGNRICELPDGTTVYVGHKMHMNFLRASEEEFNSILTDLRMKFDGLRMVFGGHLHFQTYKQGQLVSFINPGAVHGAIGWGYEFAVIDNDKDEVVFGRILPTPDDRPVFSVGVISDSLDVSHRDAFFWKKLAHEFRLRDVSKIIHCGNLHLSDIGRPELSKFEINYAIRKDQEFEHRKMQEAGKIPPNWKVILEKDLEPGGVVDIDGYRFYVQLDLGLEFMKVSEIGMDSAAMKIRRKYPETEFVLCGFTREALLVEGQHVTIINPGDVNMGRSFVVICLPRKEITFGHVPFDVLPTIKKEGEGKSA